MRVGPLSRRLLVAGLQELGFDGPKVGGNHEPMEGRGRRVPIPNPHAGDLSRGLIARILREAGVDREEWKSMKVLR